MKNNKIKTKKNFKIKKARTFTIKKIIYNDFFFLRKLKKNNFLNSLLAICWQPVLFFPNSIQRISKKKSTYFDKKQKRFAFFKTKKIIIKKAKKNLQHSIYFFKKTSSKNLYPIFTGKNYVLLQSKLIKQLNFIYKKNNVIWIKTTPKWFQRSSQYLKISMRWWKLRNLVFLNKKQQSKVTRKYVKTLFDKPWTFEKHLKLLKRYLKITEFTLFSKIIKKKLVKNFDFINSNASVILLKYKYELPVFYKTITRIKQQYDIKKKIFFNFFFWRRKNKTKFKKPLFWKLMKNKTFFLRKLKKIIQIIKIRKILLLKRPSLLLKSNNKQVFVHFKWKNIDKYILNLKKKSILSFILTKQHKLLNTAIINKKKFMWNKGSTILENKKLKKILKKFLGLFLSKKAKIQYFSRHLFFFYKFVFKMWPEKIKKFIRNRLFFLTMARSITQYNLQKKEILFAKNGKYFTSNYEQSIFRFFYLIFYNNLSHYITIPFKQKKKRQNIVKKTLNLLFCNILLTNTFVFNYQKFVILQKSKKNYKNMQFWIKIQSQFLTINRKGVKHNKKNIWLRKMQMQRLFYKNLYKITAFQSKILGIFNKNDKHSISIFTKLRTQIIKKVKKWQFFRKLKNKSINKLYSLVSIKPKRKFFFLNFLSLKAQFRIFNIGGYKFKKFYKIKKLFLKEFKLLFLIKTVNKNVKQQNLIFKNKIKFQKRMKKIKKWKQRVKNMAIYPPFHYLKKKIINNKKIKNLFILNRIAFFINKKIKLTVLNKNKLIKQKIYKNRKILRLFLHNFLMEKRKKLLWGYNNYNYLYQERGRKINKIAPFMPKERKTAKRFIQYGIMRVKILRYELSNWKKEWNNFPFVRLDKKQAIKQKLIILNISSYCNNIKALGQQKNKNEIKIKKDTQNRYTKHVGLKSGFKNDMYKESFLKRKVNNLLYHYFNKQTNFLFTKIKKPDFIWTIVFGLKNILQTFILNNNKIKFNNKKETLIKWKTVLSLLKNTYCKSEQVFIQKFSNIDFLQTKFLNNVLHYNLLKMENKCKFTKISNFNFLQKLLILHNNFNLFLDKFINKRFLNKKILLLFFFMLKKKIQKFCFSLLKKKSFFLQLYKKQNFLIHKNFVNSKLNYFLFIIFRNLIIMEIHNNRIKI